MQEIFPAIEKSIGKTFGFCLCLSVLAHAGAFTTLPGFQMPLQPQPVSLQINLMSLAAPAIEPAKIEPAAGEEVKTPDIEIASVPKAREIIARPKPKPEPVKKQAPKPVPQPVEKQQPLQPKPAPPQLTSNARGHEETTVIPVLKDVSILKQTVPVYPAKARRMGQQGTVLIHALITGNGDMQDLKIASSSGYASLDQSAMKAVKDWRFETASRNGQPIKAWVEVPVRFVLR